MFDTSPDLEEKVNDGGMPHHQHMKDWLESVADFGVKALIILGPDHLGTDQDRKVFAVYPPQILVDAEKIAKSDYFGADWRSSYSPLSGFNNFRPPKNDWEARFLEAGFLSLVRIEFPLTLNRAFECFMLCDHEIYDRTDAAVISYAMLGAWPLLKRSVSMGRLDVTERERESLLAAAEGLTANQAASKMACTERTIHFFWSNVVKKLGADTKMAAVQRGIWLGLI